MNRSNLIFKTMLKRFPKCHEAYYGLGRANFSIRAFETSRDYFYKALKISKDDVY